MSIAKTGVKRSDFAREQISKGKTGLKIKRHSKHRNLKTLISITSEKLVSATFKEPYEPIKQGFIQNARLNKIRVDNNGEDQIEFEDIKIFVDTAMEVGVYKIVFSVFKRSLAHGALSIDNITSNASVLIDTKKLIGIRRERRL
jgi:hypothetical protein